jgi:hypothetical protein
MDEAKGNATLEKRPERKIDLIPTIKPGPQPTPLVYTEVTSYHVAHANPAHSSPSFCPLGVYCSKLSVCSHRNADNGQKWMNIFGVSAQALETTPTK